MQHGIDLLRHFLALCVIVQHMPSGSRYDETTLSHLSRFIDFIDGAVFAFFLISGFLAKTPTAKPVYFIKRQAQRLLLPYFILSFVYGALMILLGKASAYSALVGPLILAGPGMQLYFLPLLFLITTVFFVLRRSTPTGLRPGIEFTIFLALLCCALALPSTHSTGPDARLWVMYACMFALGLILGRQNLSTRLWLSATCVVCFLIISRHDPRFFDAALAVTVFSVFTMAFSSPARFRIGGSGAVYVLHTPILNFAVSTALAAINIRGMPNVLLSVVLSYLSCLGIFFLTARLVPSVLWVILEERKAPDGA